MNTMDAIMGKGWTVKCTQHIHWFKSGARVGDKCLCGQKVKESKLKKKKEAA